LTPAAQTAGFHDGTGAIVASLDADCAIESGGVIEVTQVDGA
jgi:hypothetical protein